MKRANKATPKRRRRRILLAMDLNLTVERRVGIAQYAREAGWILESRLFVFLFYRQHKEYLESIRVDGILSMVQ